MATSDSETEFFVSAALDRLRSAFTKVDRKYAPVAMWNWNGHLHEAELGRQLTEFAGHGLAGVAMQARESLQTPYFGGRWWDAVDYTVRKGQTAGLTTWICDEYGSPSGSAGSTDARNGQTISAVLSAGPEHHAKTLVRKIHKIEGPQQIALEGRFPSGDPLVQVAARLDKDGHLDPSTFENLTRANTWSCPEGEWRLISFSVLTLDHHIDYLRPQTVKAFLAATYNAYEARYKSGFGSEIPGIFSHEPHIAAEPLPWTNALPARFKKDNGYDILEVLPLLVLRGGDETSKVRCDFYETVSALYEEAWFEQISSWCKRRGLEWTGYTEEHVAAHPARQGNYFRTIRHLSIPGTDHHGFRLDRPRTVQAAEVKSAVSVAALNGVDRSLAEAFGGAGWGVTPDQLRHGASLLAAYGIGFQVFRGFFYSMGSADAADDWPPSLSHQNPYWPHFGELVDYVTRLSSIVSQSKASTSIGVVYPWASIAANTADGRPNGRAREIASIYEGLIDGLLDKSVDVHVLDETVLGEARLENGVLKQGDVAVDTLILPPMPVIGRPAMRRIAAFARSGGVVVSVGERPSGSSEAGAKDRGISRTVTDVFGKNASASAGSKIGKGRAYEVGADLPEAIENIVGIVAPKITVEGSPDVFAVERHVDGAAVQIVVNRSEAKAKVSVTSGASGGAEVWNPETAEIVPLPLAGPRGKRKFDLELPPHATRLVVFDASARAARAKRGASSRRPKRTEFKTDWTFALADGTPIGQGAVKQFELPVLRTESFALGHGRLEQLRDPSYDDADWPETWLVRAGADIVGNWRGKWITGVRKHGGWAVDRLSDQHRRLRFTRSVEVNEPPIKAMVSFSAVDVASVYMNNIQVGKSEEWATPVTFNLMPYLKLGENTIVVDVECTSDSPISMLLESQIDLRSGDSVVLVSDSTWDVAAIPTEVWSERSYDRDTPLVTWERGRPPIQPWGHMPLKGDQTDFPRTLMYRQRLPVGCVGIGIPKIKGDYKVFVDVRERQADIEGIYNITTGKLLSVEIVAVDRSSGILGPLDLYARSVSVALKPWAELGYGWYSGTGIYERNFDLTAGQADSRVVLELGDVRHTAEVFVNNRRVGARLWAPYEFDISPYVQKGLNSLTVRVSNLLANEMRWKRDETRMGDPWHRYWHEDNIESESLVSGLLGPVKVRFESIG